MEDPRELSLDGTSAKTTFQSKIYFTGLHVTINFETLDSFGIKVSGEHKSIGEHQIT